MQKFKSAKQKQEFLEYQKWIDGHKTSMKKSSGTKEKPENLVYNLTNGSRETNPNGLTIRSHTVVMSSSATTKKESKQYSGTKMLGIATLHKSNACPVFSQEEAVDISKMRR